MLGQHDRDGLVTGTDRRTEPGASLDILASAIAGTPLTVALGPAGEPTWADGSTIHVDSALGATDRRTAVVVQASLVASGSLQPEILASLGRSSSTATRYLAIEGHRAIGGMRSILPPPARRLIDASRTSRAATPEDSLALARTRTPIEAPPDAFGAIRPGSVHAVRIPDGGNGSAHHVPRGGHQVLRELDDGEDTDEAGGFHTFNPVGGGGAIGRLLQRMLGTSRSRGGGAPGADAATHRTKLGGRVGRNRSVSNAAVELTEAHVAIARGPLLHPEWNTYRRSYRPDWCSVREVEVDPSTADPAPDRDTRTLRRTLAPVGLGLERRRRQPLGDDLDIDAVVEARVELAAGLTPDDRLYTDSIRRRRELSVLVLLDISGSAGQPSASGGAIHDHQVEAATGLVHALHQLGDRVALYGFRSQGRSDVQLLAVKQFDEPFDLRTRQRLRALTPGAYTRMGAAIRHGARILDDRGGTSRRLLVVLSDGFAYDHGYEGTYAEADARRALSECRRRGTACLCLSIGTDLDVPALRRVFGTAAYASLPHADRLGTCAGPLVTVALRSADLQRRTAQRRERTRERLTVEGTPG